MVRYGDPSPDGTENPAQMVRRLKLKVELLESRVGDDEARPLRSQFNPQSILLERQEEWHAITRLVN